MVCSEPTLFQPQFHCPWFRRNQETPKEAGGTGDSRFQKANSVPFPPGPHFPYIWRAKTRPEDFASLPSWKERAGLGPQRRTYILSAAAQHHVAAGPAPLDVAHGGGDQGILEEEEGAVVVQDEDVVLGGQELPVAVREQRGHRLADEMPPAAEHLEVQALGVCGTERPEGREIGAV